VPSFASSTGATAPEGFAPAGVGAPDGSFSGVTVTTRTSTVRTDSTFESSVFTRSTSTSSVSATSIVTLPSCTSTEIGLTASSRSRTAVT
jgi:hypothetical protein